MTKRVNEENVKELDTEQKILEAAKEVFMKKGYAGARMRTIAETAGINKGLLHYYFKSKEKLFDKIFHELFRKFFPEMNVIFASDKSLFEKIEIFINSYMDILIQNPYLPSFILHELNNNPDVFIDKILNSKTKPNLMGVMMQLQMEAQLGKIREINPIHLVMNIVSMCVFPFIGKPILQTVLKISEEDFLTLMELRKKEVYSFIVESLKVKT